MIGLSSGTRQGKWCREMLECWPADMRSKDLNSAPLADCKAGSLVSKPKLNIDMCWCLKSTWLMQGISGYTNKHIALPCGAYRLTWFSADHPPPSPIDRSYQPDYLWVNHRQLSHLAGNLITVTVAGWKLPKPGVTLQLARQAKNMLDSPEQFSVTWWRLKTFIASWH